MPCMLYNFSRVVTATLDKTSSQTSRLHDLVLTKFGLTPWLNTYPDFLAGDKCYQQ